MMRKNPPFPNDNFTKEIEAKIEPNRRLPFVQQKSETLQHLTTLNSKQKISESKSTTTESDGFEFKCHLCSEDFIYQVQLTSHLKFRHSEVEKPFPCSVCSDSFNTSQELNIHLGTEHPEKFRLVWKENNTNGSVKKHQCPQCPKKFNDTTQLKKHISSHMEKLHVCYDCGSKYRQAEVLRMHKADKKKCKQIIELKLSQKFNCNHCEMSTNLERNLRTHMHIIHGIKPVDAKKPETICLFCGYKALTSYKLQCHNRKHTGEKPFQCTACNTGFVQKHSLNSHIRLHCQAAKAIGLEPEVQQQKVSNPRTATNSEADIRDANGHFKCSKCDYTCKNRTDLKKHEERHGDKFMCQLCPTGFKTYVGLKSHGMRIHPMETKTFKCTFCEIAFFSSVGLRKHKWECTGQKSTKESERNQDEETEGKEKGQESADPLGVSSNHMAIIVAEKLPEAPSSSVVNATLSWVQSVTNNSSDQLCVENYDSDVIPISVLKMEH